MLWPGNEAKFAKALTQYERPETKTVLFVITPDNHVGDWCSYIITYNNKLHVFVGLSRWIGSSKQHQDSFT